MLPTGKSFRLFLNEYCARRNYSNDYGRFFFLLRCFVHGAPIYRLQIQFCSDARITGNYFSI